MRKLIVQTQHTSGVVMREVMFELEETEAHYKTFYGITDSGYYSEIIVHTSSALTLDVAIEDSINLVS